MHNKTVQKKDLMELEAYHFRIKRQISMIKKLYVDGDLTKREFVNLLIQHYARINSRIKNESKRF